VVSEHSQNAERETGLTGPQLWAMKVVADASSITVSTLAKRMYLHPATVVGILDRLEAKGLLQRTRSKKDRRVVEIELTVYGKNLIENTSEVAQGLLVKGLESATSSELKTIANGIHLVVNMLGAKETPPQLMFSSEINMPSK
jgi:DNA-binding MarR family transcriptional regulator